MPTTAPPLPQPTGAGDLQWRLDLAEPPDRLLQRTAAVVRRSGAALVVVAGSVWAYDVALVLRG